MEGIVPGMLSPAKIRQPSGLKASYLSVKLAISNSVFQKMISKIV